MKRGTFFKFASPSIIIMMLLMVTPLVMAIWLGMNYITYNNITSPQFGSLHDCRYTHANCCGIYSCNASGSGFKIYKRNLFIYLFTAIHHCADCWDTNVQTTF